MDRKLKATQRILGIMNDLREKCPWDREQTFLSLRNNTIEETFELTDAITDGNMDNIKEELGDLLLHIIFYSKMAEEQGEFDYADVANDLCEKLIYRHPHVYGEIHANTPTEVLKNWEALKMRKKNRKGGLMGGVPRSLPAMVKAFRISEKAASVGFDWKRKEDVLEKVREEMREVETEIENKDKSSMEKEIGDLLFSIVNLARKYSIDPENALELTNKKFLSRFHHIEQYAEQNGQLVSEMSLEEMEEKWQEAKKDEIQTK
ncbi:MAG: nucleoside triphosphate pyrophosphohydrolase [Alistipes sp.]|nr:nucleoside triphosphate pyrophosphohydrolase [Candidatus Alistipes equi]